MDKKTIIFELPSEIIDQIDKENNVGDRSIFITDLLHSQLKEESKMIIPPREMRESKPWMNKEKTNSISDGKLTILDKQGNQIRVFDINNIQEFELLAKKIESISKDPMVKVRARLLR